eukprot:scaffold3072_cov116-Isochrysis_galbana.AAC.8
MYLRVREWYGMSNDPAYCAASRASLKERMPATECDRPCACACAASQRAVGECLVGRHASGVAVERCQLSAYL